MAGRVRGDLSSTQLRCLPLTARFASVLSHKGRAGSLWLLLTPDMRPRCRGASQRPAHVKEQFLGASPEGVARRKAQTYDVHVLRQDMAGASRRATCASSSACYLRRLSDTGPRFPVPAMAGRSASSWQGLEIVVPGGAPMPPECLVASRPAGAAPHPAAATPRDDALRRTR
jgi:hypothetical protein